MCRNQTELFHLGQHIVVDVDTGDLPLPDLRDMTEPQFALAPPAWKSSRGQRHGSGVVPIPNPLKNGLILGGKHPGQLCPHIREALDDKQQEPFGAIRTIKSDPSGDIDKAVTFPRSVTYLRASPVQA